MFLSTYYMSRVAIIMLHFLKSTSIARINHLSRCIMSQMTKYHSYWVDFKLTLRKGGGRALISTFLVGYFNFLQYAFDNSSPTRHRDSWPRKKVERYICVCVSIFCIYGPILEFSYIWPNLPFKLPFSELTSGCRCTSCMTFNIAP